MVVGAMGVVHAQKGSVLVLVVILCAALLLLGTALVDLNGGDLQIAVNQRDSLQAYYLAETGIESALAVLTEYNTYYTGNSTTIFAEGSFTVSVSALEQANGGRHVTIRSIARTGRVKEQINLEFQSFPAFNGGTDGATLGWYDDNNGVIVPDIHTTEEIVVLLGFTSNDFPLRLLLQQEEDGHAKFAASQLFFISSPTSLVLEEALEISAETVVFQGLVVLCSPEGGLLFVHPSNAAMPVYFRERVITADNYVLLEPGFYHFPHCYQITGNSNPSELENFRKLAVVPGTMLRSGRE
jgi:hypothetical protein